MQNENAQDGVLGLFEKNIINNEGSGLNTYNTCQPVRATLARARHTHREGGSLVRYKLGRGAPKKLPQLHPGCIDPRTLLDFLLQGSGCRCMIVCRLAFFADAFLGPSAADEVCCPFSSWLRTFIMTGVSDPRNASTLGKPRGAHPNPSNSKDGGH